MAMNHQFEPPGQGFEAVIAVIIIAAFLLYPLAGMMTSRKYKKWPLHRYVFWSFGVLCAAAALTGPLVVLAHSNFKAHMLGHLLLGMLAPLLMAFAEPMTLLLRTLSTASARKLSRILRSWPARILTHPVIAAILNIGGLYVLYMTDLYTLMHQHFWLYAIVHLHVFLAGYVFTVAIVYIDLTPHRFGYVYRSIVLILALAGHKSLSKLIYAHPPSGVPKNEAEAGGMLMYYGGDLIDLALIVILCAQWYKAAAPRAEKITNETA